MITLRSLGVACALGIAVTACSSSSAPTAATPAAASQTQAGMPDVRGWMPRANTQIELVYVACTQENEIAINLGDAYIGKITNGIDEPEGLATDSMGNLYVANRAGKTITVYKPGTYTPSLTLTESNGPDDVAVGSNGYVYAADRRGIDVYASGGTSPIRRLKNSALRHGVSGVGVDASNNVYATGKSRSGAAVVKFANASGSGTNLGLRDLRDPDGVIIDKNNDLLVTDIWRGRMLIYPPGQTLPSRKIHVSVSGNPIHSALNEAEDIIYVPQSDEYVAKFDYPSGKYITSYLAGGTTLGVAVYP